MARHLRTEGLDPSRALPRDSLPPVEIVPFPDRDEPYDDDDLGDPLDLTDDDGDNGRRHIGWLLPTMAVTAVITAVALAAVALIDPAPGSARNRPVVAGATIVRPTVTTAAPPPSRPTRPPPSSIPPLESSTAASSTAVPTAVPTSAVPPTAVPVESMFVDPDGAFTVVVEATPRRSSRQLNVDGATVTQRVTTVALAGGGEASIDVLPFALDGKSADEIDQAMRNYGAGTRPWGGATPVFAAAVSVEGWRQVDATAGGYRLRVYGAANRLHLVWSSTPGVAFDRLLGSYRPTV